jgi:uncharacterized protein HemY
MSNQALVDAKKLLEAGKNEDVLKTVFPALKEDPQNPYLLYFQTAAFVKMGEWNEAVSSI